MDCAKCGGKMTVKETRHFEDETYRRIECSECGESVFTVEYEVILNDAFLDCWQRAGIIRNASRKKGN